MSGGLFPGYPFTLNIKCIIFSIIIMLIYTFKPPSLSLPVSLLVYFLIFVVSYVALAWYDYYYGCTQLPLQRSKIGITHYLKPPVYDKERQEEHMFSQKEMDKNNTTIYAMHFLLIVPLLLYIGIKKGKASKHLFEILIVLAAFTAVYHGFRLLSTSHSDKKNKN
jgi:hypothetical protein